MPKEYFNIFKIYGRLNSTHKLAIAFSTALAGMCLVTYESYTVTTEKIQSINILFENNLKPIRWINMVRVDLNANRTNLYHAIANMSNSVPGANTYLRDIPGRSARIDKHLKKTRAKMDQLRDVHLTRELASLEQELQRYRQGRARVLQLLRKGAVKQGLMTAEGHRRKAYVVFEHIARISDHIQKRAELRKERARAAVANTRRTILLVLFAALLVSGLFVLLVITDIGNLLRRLTQKMTAVAHGDLEVPDFERIEDNDMGTLYHCFNEMNGMLKKLAFFITSAASATTDISASAHQLDSTAAQSTRAAQQVSSSLEELSAGTEEIARNLAAGFKVISNVNSAIQNISRSSKNSVEISETTRKGVMAGSRQAELAMEQVNAIKTASGEVSMAITELLGLSAEIESIIGLMSNIADQTSMLSLNAAIEAARAGEEGRGFAVVAEEVGKLAGHSAQAASSVAELVRQVQTRIKQADAAMANGIKEVDEGALTIGTVGNTLGALLTEARRTSTEVAAIAGEVNLVFQNSNSLVKFVEEVSAIADESAANLEGIAKISQEQSVGTEQIFASVKSLATIAENLNTQMTSFRAAKQMLSV